VAKINYQKAKERERARKSHVDEVRALMSTPPPAWQGKTVHLQIKCKRCKHTADMLLSADRLARGVMLRCSQCGAKRRY
jgi:hypothetical protein